MSDHPLKGLWIVHTYYGPTPWQSIMDLPEEEALRINATLKFPKSHGIDPVTGQETYYKLRQSVEAWSRKQHLAHGGAIDCPNPVYATLVETHVPSVQDHPMSRLCFPAECVDPRFISITIGDSFPNFLQAKATSASTNLMGRSYSPGAFMALLYDGKLPNTWPNSEHTNNKPFYVEVCIFTRNLPTFEMALRLAPSQRPAGLSTQRGITKIADDLG